MKQFMMNGPQEKPTIHLYSFGYKHGGPPPDENGNGGGFVFDCRALPNPYWNEELRPFSGREEPVRRFMEERPEVAEFTRHAESMVLFTGRVYRELGRENLMVCFGCTGGRHRSVYQAERLSEALARAGYRTTLTHLHMHLAEIKDRQP